MSKLSVTLAAAMALVGLALIAAETNAAKPDHSKTSYCRQFENEKYLCKACCEHYNYAPFPWVPFLKCSCSYSISVSCFRMSENRFRQRIHELASLPRKERKDYWFGDGGLEG